jgi:hypothetical protein
VRLDAEKLEVLRSWGDGLSGDEREEIRSAGRAILLLIEEIERLHIDLWHLRRLDGSVTEVEEAPPPEAEPDAGDLGASLRRRLLARRRT